jgi:uncharacterized protein
MKTFEDFLETINNPEHQSRTKEVLDWITATYPHLAQRIAWNQPMFTDHGTFIIGFSVSKQHLAVTPEQAGIEHFTDEIKHAGYQHTKMIIRFPWSKPVDYKLLARMIEYNISEKQNCTTFWR